MPKNLIVWLPTLGIMTLLGACGSDSVGSSAATVQERIDRCHDGYASCDGSSDDCEAGAMGCMNAVHGNGANQDDVAGRCDALYELCSTKTEDLAFCEDLRQACFDCVDRYDDDRGGDDGDSDEGDDSDSDDGHDDSGDDGDDDGDSDDDDRCRRDHDEKDGNDDDDDDEDDDDDDDDYDDDDDGDDDYDDDYDDENDCDPSGSGGMSGTGGSGGMTGTGGTGGMTGTGGSGGMAGAGGSGGMTGTGGTGGGFMGVSFALDIQPYFEAGQANCVRCHSGGGPAGVDLDSYANILAGGDGFPLVVPGDSSDPSAALIPQLNANHLNGPDDAGFVVILSQWIDEGALDN